MSKRTEIISALPEKDARSWLLIAKVGLPIAILSFFLTVALHFDYTPDDTYIYLQYAKNLIDGNGFAFNKNIPSYGTTGPLWTLLIASGKSLGIDPYLVAKTFDLVFASLALLIFFFVALSLIRDRLYAFVALLLFATDAWFLRWTSSGMETSASVLLILVASWYMLKNDYLIASLAAGALTLIRPEGALFFLVLMIDNILNTTQYKPALKVAMRSITIYLLVVLPWLIFAKTYFGSFLPNTFAAKSGLTFSISESFETLISIVKIIGSTQGISFAIMVLTTFLVLRRYGFWKLRTELFGIFWIGGLILFYAITNVQVVSRYLLMAVPFILLYCFWGLKKMEELYSVKPKIVLIVLSALLLVGVAQNRYIYHSQAVPHMRSFVEGMKEAIEPIAYWLKENSEEDAIVLAPDIGLLAYRSDRQIYDVAGLVTPEVRRTFSGLSYDEGMLRRSYEEVVKPDYVIHRSPIREMLTAEDMIPIMTREFRGLGITKKETQFFTLYKMVR